MAETKQVTETKPFSFNDVAVKEKFAKIEVSVNNIKGKKGYNPYLWMKKNVDSFVERYIKGERSHALQESILALPDHVPSLYPIGETPSKIVTSSVEAKA